MRRIARYKRIGILFIKILTVVVKTPASYRTSSIKSLNSLSNVFLINACSPIFLDKSPIKPFQIVAFRIVAEIYRK